MLEELRRRSYSESTIRGYCRPNYAENGSKTDMVPKCSRDAPQSWKGPKVMIRDHVAGNKK
jgi:hypothetical protein